MDSNEEYFVDKPQFNQPAFARLFLKKINDGQEVFIIESGQKKLFVKIEDFSSEPGGYGDIDSRIYCFRLKNSESYTRNITPRELYSGRVKIIKK